MVETATGLVLRTRLLTETSLIVHWLTASCGRVATVAKGARRPDSPFRGKLDLFYLADFSFTRSRRSDLHALREVKLVDPHSYLREELASLQKASYCALLVEQTTETETPLAAVFDLTLALLGHLKAQSGGPQTIFAFELKLLEELGLQPSLEESRLSPGTRQLARLLAQTDWPVLPRFRLSGPQERELQQFLHGYLIYHLGRIPKGREHALWPGGRDQVR